MIAHEAFNMTTFPLHTTSHTTTHIPFVHRLRQPLVASNHPPVLLLLHGVGANEGSLAALAATLDPRLLIILVRAPIQLGAHQYGFFNVNFSAAGPVIHAEQAEQSRQELISFIQMLPEIYSIDPKRVWIAGFSQGGIMSASVALSSSGLVAGFGILSGRILPEIKPVLTDSISLSQLHAFVSHGVSDSKLGIHFGRASEQLLQGLGVPVSYHEYDADHEVTQDMAQDFGRWISAQIHPE